MLDVYLITPEAEPTQIAETVVRALREPAPPRVGLQLRQKSLARAALVQLGRQLRELTRARGVALLVNGDPELARELGADGVHQPDGAPHATARAMLGSTACIGASCHDAASLERAATEGASFAVLSPLNAVAGKAPPLGLARFGALARAARLPVLALGGVDAGCARDALGAGACGVAVTRAVFDSPEPGLALRTLSATVREHRSKGAEGPDRDSMT